MKKILPLFFILLISAGKGPMPIPGFKVVDLHSNAELTSASLKGKVALFNFWGLDAQGKAQQDVLSQLQQRYPDTLVVISACITKEDKQKVKTLIQEKGWSHAIAKASRGFKDYSFLKELPYTFVIDSSGLIQTLALGSQDAAALEKLIQPLMQPQNDNPVMPPVLPDKQNPDTISQTGSYIILYGRPQCGNCKAMRNHLDYEGLTYQDLNVDEDKSANQEMWKKVRASSADSSRVMLPVMDVNGYIMVNPSWTSVQETLKKPRVRSVQFPHEEKIPLDQIKGELGQAFSDKKTMTDFLLTGFQVRYDDKNIYCLYPIYSQVINEKYIATFSQLNAQYYGGTFGLVKRLEKPGYAITGLRLCEETVNGTVTIKKLAVIWKKWGDDSAKLEMSEYLGSDSDEGDCIEIMAPPGKWVVGVHGYYQPNRLINRVSLLVSEVQKK